MNLVTQVRGEGLLGLFQEVNMITQEASTTLNQNNTISDGCNTALCESFNGEVSMINFQFLRKNVTFTF